jgi:hypothetical protein
VNVSFDGETAGEEAELQAAAKRVRAALRLAKGIVEARVSGLRSELPTIVIAEAQVAAMILAEAGGRPIPPAGRQDGPGSADAGTG